ncbi:hypothetical protein HMPREF9701_00952 [Delftia acidovorans CCUG 274B]|uniref:Uncharacterized protein n=1 Tax=Delftia lacustris TaxID=558537 RepID=A0A1H3SI56_9BURK|nr:hypothetical protein HMPREF9701_00952 [Delftia acidovorans CCUG 274B]SDZ36789.1 hypothetical protein SAMN05421547_12012 [Delftia lacustris]
MAGHAVARTPTPQPITPEVGFATHCLLCRHGRGGRIVLDPAGSMGAVEKAARGGVCHGPPAHTCGVEAKPLGSAVLRVRAGACGYDAARIHRAPDRKDRACQGTSGGGCTGARGMAGNHSTGGVMDCRCFRSIAQRTSGLRSADVAAALGRLPSADPQVRDVGRAVHMARQGCTLQRVLKSPYPVLDVARLDAPTGHEPWDARYAGVPAAGHPALDGEPGKRTGSGLSWAAGHHDASVAAGAACSRGRTGVRPIRPGWIG